MFPFIFILRSYQKIVAPWLFPCCRFTPSCSQYSIDSFRKHGVLKGLILTSWRLMRCQPFCRGGYDPAPDSFTFKRAGHEDKLAFTAQKN